MTRVRREGRRSWGRFVGGAFAASLLIAGAGLAFDQSTTVGFEDPGQWKPTLGTLGMSATHTQGSMSLAWTIAGNGEITSTLLATTAGVGTTLSYQVRMPAVAPDPNFRGDTQAYITSVSRNVNHQFIGQVSLANFPLGSFALASMPIPTAIRNSLTGTVNDIRIHIVLNTPTTRSATYLLDDLRVGLTAPPVVDDIAFARRVMSFESAPDWTTSGPATLAATTTKTGGASALAITTTGGWIPIMSRPVRSAPGLGAVVSMDIMLPDEQPNPTFFGAVQLYVNAPSAGINNGFVSQAELTGLQTGVFSTVRFVLPDDTLSRLKGPFDDLQFTVILNVPTGVQRVYRIDELRYSQVTTSVITASRTPGLRPTEVGGVDPVTGAISVFPTRDGVLGGAAQTVVPELAGTQASCFADVDGNGTTDIVFANPRTRSIGFLPRIDIGLPAYKIDGIRTVDPTTPIGVPANLTCGDIDGDGDTDLVISFTAIEPDSGFVSTAYAYLNQGAGQSFTRVTLNLGFPGGIELAGKALADFTGDGKADLALLAAGPTSDGNQLFVFPATGNASAPFSSSQKITIAQTSPLSTSDLPLWGAVTIVDVDGDLRPDIWALGNRGLVLTVRSLGGSQFAAPTLAGALPSLGGQFTIAGLDIDGDGRPDLIGTPRLPPFPQPTPSPFPPGVIFPGTGGGILVRPPGSRPWPGPPVGTSVVATSAGGIIVPPAGTSQEVGLVKSSPVVTTYNDGRGERLSIFMVGVNGHLLERLQRVLVTLTTTVTGPGTPTPIFGNGTFGSGFHCNASFCIEGAGGPQIVVVPQTTTTETDTEQWIWVDHGTPPGTLVESPPAVSWINSYLTDTREVFVRGLDGHLWQMEIFNNARQWLDRGLPPAATTGAPTVPLVGTPTVAVDPSTVIGGTGTPTSDLYALDAAGNLDHFQAVTTRASVPAKWLTTLGQIGNNNCVGAVGKVGEGSPVALLWFGDDRFEHKQVVVTSAEGDLYSWRDGVWENALTSGIRTVFAPRGSQVIRCPNDAVHTTVMGAGQNVTKWAKTSTVRGTPAALVWYQGGHANRNITALTPWESEELKSKGVGSGDLREYHYGPDCQGLSLAACELALIASATGVQDGLLAATLAVPPASVPGSPFQRGLITPFNTEADSSKRDLFLTDPALVQAPNGDVVTMGTTGEGSLTLTNACRAGVNCGLFGLGSIIGERIWRKQRVNPNAVPNFDLQRLVYSPAGIIRSDTLTLFATRARGYLTSLVDTPTTTDFPGTDHPPDNPPIISDHDAGRDQAFGCRTTGLGDQIFPQWAGEKRDIKNGHPELKDQLYPDGNFNTGYDAEKMVAFQGVVVGSHIAAIDTPINHTIETANIIPTIHHDWNLTVRPDVQYQAMMSDGNMTDAEAGDKSELGAIVVEWELDDAMMPINVVPAVGDRIAVRGRHIYDCGHPPFRREIHPPDAMALIHGNTATIRISSHGGPTWFQPTDTNLPNQDPVSEPGGKACDVVGNIGNLFGSLGFSDLLFAGGCNRRVQHPLSTIGPGPNGSCQFPYEHSMTDFLGDNVPLEFDVPLPVPAGTNPQIPFGAFESTFVATPAPHFHVTVLPEQMAAATLFGPSTQRIAATWGGVSPQPRFFNVCFQRQGLIAHDTQSISSNISAGIDLAGKIGEEIGGEAGDVISTIVLGLPLGALLGISCDVDEDDEPILYGTANDSTIRIIPSGSDNCIVPAVRVMPNETLSIHVQGYECDFSCGEHWDDDFVESNNDRMGHVDIAFTAAQNFGGPCTPQSNGTCTPILGQVASYQFLSQPDLATPKSRRMSAGDYRMTVTVKEAIPGNPNP